MDKFIKLIDELRKLRSEASWVEFKHNNYKPDMIGEDISAIANVSRVIRDPVAIGLVRAVDPKTAPRYMRYVPAWA